MTETLSTLYRELTGHAPADVKALTPAGSNRRYYRLTADGEEPLIGVEGTSVAENRAFVAIARQLRHRINVGGLGCAAIGTDFDGIHGELEFPDASRMPDLFDALSARGFTDNELEHITHLNAERALREILR